MARPEDLALSVIGLILAFTVIGPLHYGFTPSSPEAVATRVVSVLLETLEGT